MHKYMCYIHARKTMLWVKWHLFDHSYLDKHRNVTLNKNKEVIEWGWQTMACMPPDFVLSATPRSLYFFHIFSVFEKVQRGIIFHYMWKLHEIQMSVYMNKIYSFMSSLWLLLQQSICVEMLWLTKPKIFIILPFIEKVCWSLLQHREDSNSY